MLNEIARNKYVKLAALVLMVPICFIGISYAIEIVFNLGKVIGFYLSCI